MRELVLIAGWGMRASVWEALARECAQSFRVRCVDALANGGAQALVDNYAANADARVTVCGWSLGAQLALRWALAYPQQVEHLVLIAATPCFVARPDWAHGMARATFDAFAANFARDADGTLERFAALQAHGDDAARAVARTLRPGIALGGDVCALGAGLELLAVTDMRSELAAAHQRTLVVHGERDAVVPLAAGEYLARSLPQATFEAVAGAGHAPFVTREAMIARRIAEFCDE